MFNYTCPLCNEKFHSVFGTLGKTVLDCKNCGVRIEVSFPPENIPVQTIICKEDSKIVLGGSGGNSCSYGNSYRNNMHQLELPKPGETLTINNNEFINLPNVCRVGKG